MSTRQSSIDENSGGRIMLGLKEEQRVCNKSFVVIKNSIFSAKMEGIWSSFDV